MSNLAQRMIKVFDDTNINNEDKIEEINSILSSGFEINDTIVIPSVTPLMYVLLLPYDSNPDNQLNQNPVYEIVEYLLNKGADPLKKDGNGISVLDYANSRKRKLNRIKKIYENGAEENNWGNSKIYDAKRLINDTDEVIELLEKAIIAKDKEPKAIETVKTNEPDLGGKRRRKTRKSKKTYRKRSTRKH